MRKYISGKDRCQAQRNENGYASSGDASRGVSTEVVDNQQWHLDGPHAVWRRRRCVEREPYAETSKKQTPAGVGEPEIPTPLPLLP
jgi:hypothetical protein